MKLVFFTTMTVLLIGCNNRTEWDKIQFENPKMIPMVDEEIRKKILLYTKSTNLRLEEAILIKDVRHDFSKTKLILDSFKSLKEKAKLYESQIGGSGNCKFCMETSRAQAIAFFNSISTIESYARYGVMSMQNHNQLELKIVFNNGTIANKVYTGHSCYGSIGPTTLMKIWLKDGKTIKVTTNGAEKKGSPDWVKSDIKRVISSAIEYDIIQHRALYFGTIKTEKDYEKEWEEK